MQLLVGEQVPSSRIFTVSDISRRSSYLDQRKSSIGQQKRKHSSESGELVMTFSMCMFYSCRKFMSAHSVIQVHLIFFDNALSMFCVCAIGYVSFPFFKFIIKISYPSIPVPRRVYNRTGEVYKREMKHLKEYLGIFKVTGAKSGLVPVFFVKVIKKNASSKECDTWATWPLLTQNL